jgi:hypothetical protein
LAESRGRAESRSFRKWCADAQPLSRIGEYRPKARNPSYSVKMPTGRRPATAAPIAPPGDTVGLDETRKIDMDKLEGRIAIVTDAASSLGLATSKRFAAEERPS